MKNKNVKKGQELEAICRSRELDYMYYDIF